MTTLITHNDLAGKRVRIEICQTTFAILNVDERNVRIDYDDKEEFRLKKHESGVVHFYDEHPLLINYNEQSAETYINSRPDNVHELISEIKSCIDSITLGWRDWTTFFTDKMIHFSLEHFTHNIENGYGKLLDAPRSITERVVEACNNHKAETKVFFHKEPSYQCKLMMIENNYVIAKDFKLSNSAPPPSTIIE